MSSSGKSKLTKITPTVENMDDNERAALELSAELTRLGKACANLAIKLVNGQMRDESLGETYKTLIKSVRQTREALIQIAQNGERK